MSIRINDKIISGAYANQSYRYVGEIFQSTLPINDSRVALLDGHKIYESEGYGSFIQYITSLALLYPQLACTEDEWQLSNTTYGECGKFVVTNDSVRLPKIISFVQGLSSLQDLATLVEAGLPNVEGTLATFDSATGAFKQVTSYGTLGGTNIPTKSTIFDASLSNPIYGNSPTVQPQSIRYPYYIVLATGVTQEVKVKEELMTNIPFTLFESKYSEVELNNTSWLLSSGQWNSKSLYPSAYNELVKKYNAGSNKYSIKLYTDEYGDYDFVLNLDNETFRLPLLDGSENLPSDRYVDLTLNASGSTYIAPANGRFIFYFGKENGDTTQYIAQLTNMTNGDIVNITFPPTSSWVHWGGGIDVKKADNIRLTYQGTLTSFIFRFIYTQGNGSLYFYVGDTNINASLVDTGKLTQEVANLIPNNSSLISGYAMPSSRYIDLTLGASGTTYTAPANGWFYVSKVASGEHYLCLKNTTTTMAIESRVVRSGEGLTTYIPVKKGDVCRVTYDAGGATQDFRFIYAEGEQ